MSWRARALGSWLLVAAFAAPAPALARVDRYAVIIGNDQGRASEQPLRYAASDAQKVYDVLRDLGGFEPKDMVLLRNESASTLRSTLIALNDRIRSSLAQPERRTLLFVYYSGHADAESLHLGGSDLSVEELGQLGARLGRELPFAGARRLPLGRADARQGRHHRRAVRAERRARAAGR